MEITAAEIREIIRQELGSIKQFEAPVSLRKAAEACGVEYKWLLERVQRGEVVAYRPNPDASWRIYVKDVVAYLTATSNQKAVRRLRRVA